MTVNIAPASMYLDPGRRPPAVDPEHIKELHAFNLDADQARFAVEIMCLGSVFLALQADVWLFREWPPFSLADTAEKRKTLRERFLTTLSHSQRELKPVAKTYRLKQGGTEYGMINSFYHYQLVGLKNSYYDRPRDDAGVVNHLLLYDYIVRHPEFAWYGNSQKKMELFHGLGIPSDTWPHAVYQSTRPGVGPTYSYFSERHPIGLRNWHVVFTSPGTFDRKQKTGMAIFKSHKKLFAALRQRGFWVTVVISYQKGQDISAFDSEPSVVGPQAADREALMRSFWREFLAVSYQYGDDALLKLLGGRSRIERRNRELLADCNRYSPPATGPMELILHECEALPVFRR